MYSLSTTAVLCALISSCFAECPSTVTRLEVEDIVATRTITSYAATLQVVSGAPISRSTTTIEELITTTASATLTISTDLTPPNQAAITETHTFPAMPGFTRVQDSLSGAIYVQQNQPCGRCTVPGPSSPLNSSGRLRARAVLSSATQCLTTVTTCSTTTRTCATVTTTVMNTTPVDFYVSDQTTIAAPLYLDQPALTTTLQTTTTAYAATETVAFAVGPALVLQPVYAACDAKNFANYIMQGNGSTRSVGMMLETPDTIIADVNTPSRCCTRAFESNAAAWMLSYYMCYLYHVSEETCLSQNGSDVQFQVNEDPEYEAIVGNGPCGKVTLY